MSGRVLLMIVLGFVGSLSVASRADSVDDLAKEGHWLKGKAWEAHKVLIGKPAPKLEMSNWIGKEVAEKDMKDKIVVVDFWATWCGPCKAAVPHTNELAKKYAEKGVVVVGACGGGREENMPKVVEETKMAYPTGKINAETTKAWSVQYWPHYVIVDRKGNIRAIGIQPDFVEKVVEALLAESEKK